MLRCYGNEITFNEICATCSLQSIALTLIEDILCPLGTDENAESMNHLLYNFCQAFKDQMESSLELMEIYQQAGMAPNLQDESVSSFEFLTSSYFRNLLKEGILI